MNSLLRKVVIITGASSGLGAASAVELAQYSPRLVLHGRNVAALEGVKQKCIDAGVKSGDVGLVTGDICDDNTISSLVQTAKDKFGAINVIFNNAGYVHPSEGPIHMGGTVEALDEMHKVNVRAPYLLVQQSIPELEKSKGVIINCSSGLARGVDPMMTAYGTTKAGLDQLTRLLALSLGMKGIRVNSINPGYVRTQIIARRFGDEVTSGMFDFVAKGTPLEQRLASPEDIARVVAFLASDASSAIHGETLYCDMAATLTNTVVDFTAFK